MSDKIIVTLSAEVVDQLISGVCGDMVLIVHANGRESRGVVTLKGVLTRRDIDLVICREISRTLLRDGLIDKPATEKITSARAFGGTKKSPSGGFSLDHGKSKLLLDSGRVDVWLVELSLELERLHKRLRNVVCPCPVLPVWAVAWAEKLINAMEPSEGWKVKPESESEPESEPTQAPSAK